MSVVLRHIPLFTVLNGSFAPLEVSRLPRIQLTVLDAIRNALLLVFLATIYLIHPRMAGIHNTRTRARS